MAREQFYGIETTDRVLDTAEHKLHLGGPRRYDPDAGASAEDGAQMSLLTEMCSGDWSWKPGRDKHFRSGWKDGVFFDDFKTFRGVPPSAAELYGPRILS